LKGLGEKRAKIIGVKRREGGKRASWSHSEENNRKEIGSKNTESGEAKGRVNGEEREWRGKKELGRGKNRSGGEASSLIFSLVPPSWECTF